MQQLGHRGVGCSALRGGSPACGRIDVLLGGMHVCGSVRAESMLLLLMLQAGKTPLHDAAEQGRVEV